MNKLYPDWDVGPHEPLDVERLFQEFVNSVGGEVLDETLVGQRDFKNADFIFKKQGVVIELKEIQKEFNVSKRKEIEEILIENNYSINSNENLLKEVQEIPLYIQKQIIRLSRNSLNSILKKANKQIRETKQRYGIKNNSGVAIIVNDGFCSLPHDLIIGLMCQSLSRDYTSIDCLLYVTVNTYSIIPGSDEPTLFWRPVYSMKSDEALANFIDILGSQFHELLATKINFTSSSQVNIETEVNSLIGSKALLPNS